VTSSVEPTPLVLVVDDDPDLRRVIRAVLEDEGPLLTTAADGGQAVAVAARRPPVLAITADGRAAEKARQLAAYAYLRKPFELGDLVAEVWRGLGRAPAR